VNSASSNPECGGRPRRAKGAAEVTLRTLRRRAQTWTRTAKRLIVEPILTVIFPSSCPACAEPVAHPTRGPLCESCWETLPRHSGRLCRCGFPLPETIDTCGRCRRGLSAFANGASLGPYEAQLRIAIHELKYHGRRRVAARLAEEMLRTPEVRAALDGAVVVEVPLHPRRRVGRGFNQASLLADALAAGASAERAERALVRRRETVPQSGLSVAARRRNVSGAFSVRRRGRVAGRSVVLVDDIITTGATARACASALRLAGAREVRVVTVARVP
jgi:ComF family protein